MGERLSDSRFRSMRALFRMVPSVVVTSAGFGLFLLSTEANRLPSVQAATNSASSSTTTPITNTITVIALIVLAIALRDKLERLTLPNVAIVALGALHSVALYELWGLLVPTENAVLAMLCGEIARIVWVVLFFCWINELFPRGPVVTAVAFSLGCIVSAACSGFTALMRADAAVGVLALLPTAASLCLCYVRAAFKREPAEPDEANGAIDVDVRALRFDAFESAKEAAYRHNVLRLVAMSVSMLCYAFVFGYVHMQWVTRPVDDAGYLIMQAGVALGSACAGAFTLLFVRYLWSYFNLQLYLFSLVPVTILALWLTSFVHGASLLFYLILLNFAQKSLYFLMVVFPFAVKMQRSAYLPWIVICLSFEVGKLASVYAMDWAYGVYDALSAVASIVLFCCCAFVMSIDAQQHGQHEASNAAANADSATAGSEPKAQPPHRNRFRHACEDLAEEHQLTEREFDAFFLLARGRTAGHIAETLVISPSTAKVYTRSIYAKLGVHSQQDLISMVEQRIDEQRDEENIATSGTARTTSATADPSSSR